MHYSSKIRRIGLILAISEYSKVAFDRAWKVPTKLVYPACNMIQPSQVRENIVVTAARAVPEKRLELFWDVARRCPNYDFVLLMTQDPRFFEYSLDLAKMAPVNGQVIINPEKRVYQGTLARSRFYLHLMRGEHFGITVVEAMSAGCVPVVHNSGGPKEIVGNCGFLWQTIEEIPDIFRLADSSYASMSELSMRRARVFSRERFVEELGEVFEETFSRSPGRDQ
jgi:glycosyltransferase involved in cell wall biosynthesis